MTETDQEGSGEQVRTPTEAGPMKGCRDATKPAGRKNDRSARRRASLV